MECVSCDATLTEGARFCAACGAAAQAAPVGPAAEERRVVTAVFCDLVGSTALSGRLDSESLRAVLLRYFDAVRTRIEAHGGTVEKYIGDAVMAVFGVPETHEDDARRALTAVLETLDAVQDLNTELAQGYGVRIEVRIGVNTGEVVTAAGGSARQALASGEVINVAARLEQNAAVGQILIGPDTLRAAGGAAVTEPAGPIQLKGKADPVTAYRLLGVRARDPEFTRRFATPFVGREGELAHLYRSLGQVTGRSAAHMVTVYGDAGIGKTRLVQEWLAQAPGLGPGVLIGAGRCHPYGDTGTLTPLGDALRQLMDVAAPTDPPAAALAILEAGLLKDGTPNPSVADTCGAAARVLAEFARARGAAVVVLDDCHWGAPGLFDVLDQLAVELAGEPVLFLCLARPDLLDRQPGWGGGVPNSASISLGRLTPEQSARLAADLAEVCAHDAESSARVLERAEGNPLHLEQLISALAETGEADEIPPTVQALLATRISALTQEQRTVLQLAAVVGREFAAPDVIALATAETAPDLRHALPELVGRRLIETVRGRTPGTTSYRFSSGLIQEVTYRGTTKRVRAQCHELMARRCIDEQRPPAVIAGHLESAYRCRADLGPLDEHAEALRRDAARRLAEAGAVALSHSDPGWAGDLLERALALASPADPGWAAAARHAAEARLALGRIPEGRALLTEVLAAASDDGDSLTEMHVRLALAATDGDAASGESLTETAHEALTLFTRSGDNLGIARASIRIAQVQQFHGQHAEAERLLTRAVEHAALAGAEPERAVALGAIGVSLWWGPVPAAEAAERCRSLLAEHGERRAARVTLNYPLAILLALHERWDEARACLDIAGSGARALGYAEAAVFIPLFTSAVEILAGRTGPAEDMLREAMAAAQATGEAGLLDPIRRDLARLLMERGEVEEAARLLGGSGGPDGGDSPGDHLPPSAAADAYGIAARIAVVRANRHRPSGLDAASLAARALATARLTDSPVVLAMAELDSAHVYRGLGRVEAATAAAAHAAELFRRKQHLVGEGWALAFAAEAGQP